MSFSKSTILLFLITLVQLSYAQITQPFELDYWFVYSNGDTTYSKYALGRNYGTNEHMSLTEYQWNIYYDIAEERWEMRNNITGIIPYINGNNIGMYPQCTEWVRNPEYVGGLPQPSLGFWLENINGLACDFRPSQSSLSEAIYIVQEPLLNGSDLSRLPTYTINDQPQNLKIFNAQWFKFKPITSNPTIKIISESPNLHIELFDKDLNYLRGTTGDQIRTTELGIGGTYYFRVYTYHPEGYYDQFKVSVYGLDYQNPSYQEDGECSQVSYSIFMTGSETWKTILDNGTGLTASIFDNQEIGNITAQIFNTINNTIKDDCGNLYIDRTITLNSEFPAYLPIKIRLYHAKNEWGEIWYNGNPDSIVVVQRDSCTNEFLCPSEDHIIDSVYHNTISTSGNGPSFLSTHYTEFVTDQLGTYQLVSLNNLITSTEHPHQDEFMLLPNPFENEFVVNTRANLHIKIMDYAGRCIFENRIEDKNVIHTSAWPSGVYFAIITNEGKVFVEKIIKE